MHHIPRNIIWGVFILIMATGVRAQTITNVQMGPLLSDNKDYELQYIFGTDSTHFFTLRHSGKKKDGIAIEKIRTDSLTVERTSRISFPDLDGAEPMLLYPLSLAGRNYLFTTTEENSSDRIFIHAWRINQGLELEKEPITVGIASKSVLNTGQQFHSYSNTSSDLFALIIPTEAQPLRNKKFEVTLWEPDLNIIHRKNLELPYEASNFQFEEVLIDSTLAIYILASVPENKLENDKGNKSLSGKEFSVIRYSWQEESIQEKSLSVGTKWLYEVRLIKNSNSTVQIAGYFSNMIELIMSGTFSVELDANTGAILNQGLVPFERSFKGQFRPTGSSPEKTDLREYSIGFLNPIGDGTIEMISEKNYTQTSTVFNPATGTYSVIKVFNFDQIVVSRIDPSGNLLSAVKVPKFQSSARYSGSYTSYHSFRLHGTTYLVYNDHERNETLSTNDEKSYRSLNSYSVAQPMIAAIGSDGVVNKQSIVKNSDTKAVMNPRYCYAIPNGLIITAFMGSRTQYIKVSLP